MKGKLRNMYKIENENQEQQYISLMEEIKDLHYQVRWLKKRSKMGIKESIKRKIKLMHSDIKVIDAIPVRERERANYFRSRRENY